MTNTRDNLPMTMIQCRSRDRPSESGLGRVFVLGFVELVLLPKITRIRPKIHHCMWAKCSLFAPEYPPNVKVHKNQFFDPPATDDESSSASSLILASSSQLHLAASENGEARPRLRGYFGHCGGRGLPPLSLALPVFSQEERSEKESRELGREEGRGRTARGEAKGE